MTVENYHDFAPKIDDEAYVHRSAVLIGQVEVAADASIWPNVVARGDINKILVGRGSSVQDGSVLHVADPYPCIIGDYVTIGHNVNLHACTIEDNCLIGIGSIVLDGAIIGKGSIVAAGTVVPPGKVIPPRSMVMGIPMKIVREIGEEGEEGNYKHAQKYIKLSKTYK